MTTVRRPVFVLALCAALLMLSATAGYALWQASATASGQVTVAQVPAPPTLTCDDTGAQVQLTWTAPAPSVEVTDHQGARSMSPASGQTTVTAAGGYSARSALGPDGWFSTPAAATVVTDPADPTRLKCGP